MSRAVAALLEDARLWNLTADHMDRRGMEKEAEEVRQHVAEIRARAAAQTTPKRARRGAR